MYLYALCVLKARANVGSSEREGGGSKENFCCGEIIKNFRQTENILMKFCQNKLTEMFCKIIGFITGSCDLSLGELVGGGLGCLFWG